MGIIRHLHVTFKKPENNNKKTFKYRPSGYYSTASGSYILKLLYRPNEYLKYCVHAQLPIQNAINCHSCKP